MSQDSSTLREEGNNHFKAGDVQQALSCYTKALKISDCQSESAVLYRNRAACYLKLEDHTKAEADATKALDVDQGDVKARFRRAQALQKLGRLDQAFTDAQKCAQLEPKNKAFQDLLRQLGAQIQQKAAQLSSTDSRVQQMFKLLLDSSAPITDRQKAAQNLVVLSREDAGAEQIFRNDGVKLLQNLLDSQQEDLILSALRTLVGLCTGHQSRTMAIVNEVGMDRLCGVMGSAASTVSLSACHLIQVMFEALTEGMKKEIRGKDEAILPGETPAFTLRGLCKLGSAGGTDFSMKQFAEGSTLKLAKQCRKWLCNEALPLTSRRWAIEGLAYLTLDADVKEDLVEDKKALQAMFELAKSEDKTVLYAVGSTLVNCTNSYDVEKPDPQMVELAKYAKQHVPEEHPKDARSFVEKRVVKLLEAGVVSALVCMVKQESPALTEACRECIARVILALVERQEDRGLVVAQGGGKNNPTIKTTFQSHRQKIIKEKAVPKIEGYMFEDHDMVRAAATECMCNLALSTEVQKCYLATDSDRLKLLVLYSGEDDERLRKAASGTLAMLTGEMPELCTRIPDTTSHWLEIFQALLLGESQDLRHRGAVIVMNLMQADKSLAEKLMESEALEILSVLAKGDDPKQASIQKAAQRCLDLATEYGLIRSNEDGINGKTM
ncbi:protein unc-45 homolog A-like [Sinocyclocheilus grahami]|uniref:protein unc-45 homolog A-like n=1 Tax=Sinocyclocheilus grahami TaxID=75366 RepID=UPI0007ACADFC|nr:PREDICTED: protein unc-45 homolog A-like [Sinocyclocheilus grahami]